MPELWSDEWMFLVPANIDWSGLAQAWQYNIDGYDR